MARPRRAHDSTVTRARDCGGDDDGEEALSLTQTIQRRGQGTARAGNCARQRLRERETAREGDGARVRRRERETAREGDGARERRHERETTREGDGASTSDVECAHALTSDAAASHVAESECTLVANRS